MKSIMDHVRSGKFATATFKRSGEMLVRSMSEKAQAAYSQNDPCEVYHSTLTGEVVIRDGNGYTSFDTAADAEKYLESIALWYAVLHDEDVTDHGTGSFNYAEAVKMAKEKGCQYIATICPNDDYCVSVDEI